ncbi:MAG: hypothetical protein M3P96_15245 [Actinomycetota bacterium]|nr:hypothetical protein [Actinomycetota bacterium]
MEMVAALPRHGQVFLDPRGADRVLRVSCHAEAGLVVLSLWQADSCTATFRLPMAEVPDLVSALVGGLAAALPVELARQN